MTGDRQPVRPRFVGPGWAMTHDRLVPATGGPAPVGPAPGGSARGGSARGGPRHPAAGRGPVLSYIGPLDGVRACAVLAVMAFHAGVGALPGGFLGVDMFFVLSGFLITSLLVRERVASGALRLGAFWAARARRLLPGLLLMLLFVAAFAYFAVPHSMDPNLREDAFFTLFYSANWHFISEGANYFVTTGPVSPLTHTWSLAVEEQFYLVWPVVVLVVMRLGVGRGLRVLLGLSVVGTLSSAAAMALLYTGSNDTRLYYGTDTHAQCILVGAVVAVLLAMRARSRASGGRMPSARWMALHVVGGDPAWAATTARGRAIVGAGGVVGVVTTAWLWTHVSADQWWLYHGGFLVAAIATALVLLSVICLQSGLVARLLALPPLRFVGRISYGLYLWHFPLFLWLDHGRTGLAGTRLVLLRFAVTLVAATLSFTLVEEPIRRRTFLRGWRGLVVAPAAVAAVGGVMILATPVVSVAAGTVLAAKPAPVPVHQVAAPDVTMLLVGDSMAQTLGNGIEGDVGQFFGLNVINAGVPDCALATGTFVIQNLPPTTSAAPCQPGSGDPGWPADWTALVNRYNPKVSVLLERLDIVDRLFDGTWTHIGDPTYDSYLEGQMQRAVQVLSARGGKVVFLTSPYFSTGEQPDGQPWPEDDPSRVDQFNQMLGQVAAAHPGTVAVVDLNKIADPDGHFQSEIDGVDVRYIDGIHWTYQGDCWLAPRILPIIHDVAVGPLPVSAKTSAALTAQAEATFSSSLCHGPSL
jgi:peptidoglycan/LPS O-acetylase OafA/YrhL